MTFTPVWINQESSPEVSDPPAFSMLDELDAKACRSTFGADPITEAFLKRDKKLGAVTQF